MTAHQNPPKHKGVFLPRIDADAFPEGAVTDVRTLDKGTLILRKERFTHFVHPDQQWKPVAIKLDFSGNKVTGTSTNANGQKKAIAVDSTGPIFGDGRIGKNRTGQISSGPLV